MNTEALKKYWPYAAGAIAVYLVYRKFSGSSSSSQASQYAALLGAQAQMSTAANQAQLAANQQQMQYAVASQQLANQNNVDTLAGIAQYNDSVGSVASSAASSLSQIIAAQSMLPAEAINAVTATNQSALQASAADAIATMGATAQGITAASQGAVGVMNAQATQTVADAAALNMPLSTFEQGVGAAYKGFSTAVNAPVATVGASANGAAQAAASSAQASIQASTTNNQTSAATDSMLAGAGLALAFSDERLKDGIVRIGMWAGFPLYAWRWNDDALELGLEGYATGVLAQEVAQRRPDAVREHSSGFLMVDYPKLVH